jgi:hypothetical protein
MPRKGISVTFNWPIHEETSLSSGGRPILRSALRDFENPRINVMAFQALECPIFKAFIGGRHAHQFHLRRAFRTSWHQVNVRNIWDGTFQF